MLAVVHQFLFSGHGPEEGVNILLEFGNIQAWMIDKWVKLKPINIVHAYSLINVVHAIPSLSSPAHQVEMLLWFVCRIRPSQLSCLGSSVGKSITWKADGRGFESHSRQLYNFSLKNDCFGQVVLCCFAFLLCCWCCLAFLSISWRIVHAYSPIINIAHT